MTKKVEKIVCLHPDGKQGVRIDAAKYESMKDAIVDVLHESPDGVRFKDLVGRVQPRLSRDVFPPECSVTWYAVTVKLDLEARKVLQRVHNAKPQRIVLAEGAA